MGIEYLFIEDESSKVLDQTPKSLFFLKSLEDGVPCSPTFKEAQETQKVCEAVLDSAKERSWKDTGVTW